DNCARAPHHQPLDRSEKPLKQSLAENVAVPSEHNRAPESAQEIGDGGSRVGKVNVKKVCAALAYTVRHAGANRSTTKLQPGSKPGHGDSIDQVFAILAVCVSHQHSNVDALA